MNMDNFIGVFDTMEECIEAAKIAQKKLVNEYSLADRDRFLNSIKKLYADNAEEMAQLEFDETGFGRYADKLDKNISTVSTLAGTEALKHDVMASNDGLTVEYYAPWGVVGAVTPSTNPSITVFGNGVCGMIAGNSMVFNGHPSAKVGTAWSVDIFNRAVVAVGGPENLLCTVKEPTMDTLDTMMMSPDVKLLVGTGGPGMVATLMRSGKRVLAAGAGNPPVVIDETADIKKAAEELYADISYENNIQCTSEKELFVVKDVFDEFMDTFEKAGAVRLNKEQGEKVTDICLTKTDDGEYTGAKKCVGKNAGVILEMAGIPVEGDPGVAFFETSNDHPLVYTEQLMPIIPVIKCENFEEAMNRAVAAEGGRHHSAAIWSNHIEHVTAFGKAIDTTIYVQNGWTSAAFGLGGTGINTATIATPTGDGLTNPQTFTRKRYFVMAHGGNYII